LIQSFRRIKDAKIKKKDVDEERMNEVFFTSSKR